MAEAARTAKQGAYGCFSPSPLHKVETLHHLPSSRANLGTDSGPHGNRSNLCQHERVVCCCYNYRRGTPHTHSLLCSESGPWGIHRREAELGSSLSIQACWPEPGWGFRGEIWVGRGARSEANTYPLHGRASLLTLILTWGHSRQQRC